MNMEMLFLMMALNPSSSGGSTSGLTDTLLYTSDMLPQMPRMLLAMNSAKNTSARHQQEIADLRRVVAGQVYQALKTVIGTNLSLRLKLTANLGSSPDLVALLREFLTPAQFDEVVDSTQ